MRSYKNIFIVLCCALVVVLLIKSGLCTTKDRVKYYDFSKKEHCLLNQAAAYENLDIEMYASTLHDDFVWIEPSGKIINRKLDIERTRKGFKISHITSMTYTKSEWHRINRLDGEACDDCWETIREVSVTVISRKSGSITTGTQKTRYIVQGVSQEGKRVYKMRFMQYVD